MLSIFSSKLIYLFSFLFFSASLYSQPGDFGKVSDDDFKIEFTSQDSSYSAVKLFKFGEYEIQKEFKYKVVIHERIKILTDQGVDQATFEIDYNRLRYDQELKKVEAYSFNLESDGDIERTKLDEDDIFEEDMGRGWIVAKFTMPRASKGTIIDVRYEMELGSAGQLPNWYFNERIPVRWSELQAEIPLFHRFELVSNLRQKLDVNKTEDSFISISYRTNPNSGTYSSSSQRVLRMKSPSQRYTWIMKNINPVKSVPYLSSVNNYRSFIFFQFKGIEIPNYGIKEVYANDWSQIIDDLLKDEQYGMQLNPEDWSKELVQSFSDDSLETIDKILKTIDYLSSFSTNAGNEFYARTNLERINNSLVATPNELNFLLIKLLRSQGIKADPVLLSTVGRGRVLRNFVLPDQFNKTICLIFIGQDRFLYDATGSENYRLLPIENLNGYGLRISKIQAEWLDLYYNSISRTNLDFTTKVYPNGNIKQDLSAEFTGYEVYFAPENKSKEDYQDFIKGIYGGSTDPEISIDTIETEEGDFLNPEYTIKTSYDNLNPDSAKTDSLDLIYLELSGFKYLNLTNLDGDKRNVPIEFPYKSIRSIKYEIEIPEGYEIDSVPDNLAYVISGVPVNYTENYSNYGNKLTVRLSLVMAQENISNEYYSDFKKIIDTVNNGMETIVLRKK